jgi:drug/metabolite transporter (DMT)-like permease
VIAKGVMPDFMSPRGIIFLRVLGAVIVFNLIHFFFVKEKAERKDLIRMAVCAMFGVAINQILFFEGLNLTTPINASIIMTTGPIMVLVFSYLALKERVSLTKFFGIILGTSGASILILLGESLNLASETFIGNLLVFINCASYSLYLVLAKPIMVKYNPITVMKWVFNFGFIYITPFCVMPLCNTNFELIPTEIWLSILYIIFGTTIMAYLLINYSMQKVSPIVSSSYIYTQPFIASIVAVFYMKEILTMIEIFAALLIFMGVYFVSIKRSKIEKKKYSLNN